MTTPHSRPIRRLQGTPAAGAVALAVAIGAALSPTAGAQAAEPEVRESLVAARELSARVEALLETLPLDREAFEVRANACTGRRGETRDDTYYIWVGMRGAAPGEDAARILTDLHARWRKAGWEITRFRRLPAGGIALAATEPATGDNYILDSGFKAGPGRYVVGYFNSPCYRSPSAVRFGSIRIEDRAVSPQGAPQ